MDEIWLYFYLDDIVEKVILGLVMWKFFCMRTFSFVVDMVISTEVGGFGDHLELLKFRVACFSPPSNIYYISCFICSNFLGF